MRDSDNTVYRGIYAITPTTSDTARLLALCESLLASGCRLIQYRSSGDTVDSATKLAQASSLKKICEQYHAALIVNDDADLAAVCGADGLHLGKNDAELEEAEMEKIRRRFRGDIGISCYNNLDIARRAISYGVAYCSFGAVYSSATKPDAPGCDLRILNEAASALPVPVVAIGGITPENAGALVDCGVDCIAVISGLFSPPVDTTIIAERYRAYQRAIKRV